MAELDGVRIATVLAADAELDVGVLFFRHHHLASVAEEVELQGAAVAEAALALGVGAFLFFGGFGRTAGAEAEREVNFRRKEVSLSKSGGTVAQSELSFSWGFDAVPWLGQDTFQAAGPFGRIKAGEGRSMLGVCCQPGIGDPAFGKSFCQDHRLLGEGAFQDAP